MKRPTSPTNANVVACSNQTYQADVPTTIRSAALEAAANVASRTRGVVRVIALLLRPDMGNFAHSTADTVTWQMDDDLVGHEHAERIKVAGVDDLSDEVTDETFIGFRTHDRASTAAWQYHGYTYL